MRKVFVLIPEPSHHEAYGSRTSRFTKQLNFSWVQIWENDRIWRVGSIPKMEYSLAANSY
ncbi:MAG: hypothetical protein AB8G22_24865 [Saprospiraceae bacterium]